jgi:hypothetical protein
MNKPKYYLLTEFGFYKDGEAWIKLVHEPPVIPGGVEYVKVSLVVCITGRYATHTYRNQFSQYDTWHKSLSGVYNNLQLCTGAYGQLNRSRKLAYEKACINCCEANQWSNGDISYVWGKPE